MQHVFCKSYSLFFIFQNLDPWHFYSNNFLVKANTKFLYELKVTIVNYVYEHKQGTGTNCVAVDNKYILVDIFPPLQVVVHGTKVIADKLLYLSQPLGTVSWSSDIIYNNIHIISLNACHQHYYVRIILPSSLLRFEFWKSDVFIKAFIHISFHILAHLLSHTSTYFYYFL